MSNSLATTEGNALQITQQYPAERFNLLVPMQTVAEIADIHKPVMNAVQISTNLDDGEIYMQEKAKEAWRDRPATQAKWASRRSATQAVRRCWYLTSLSPGQT